jgi:nucleoside-diphosphate-sugar epimerase
VKALIIGGTGPTGPFVVEGLVKRGYEPVILHRGTHEVPFVEPFEHIHADPHFGEPVAEALEGRSFDLVIASYGRLRLLVDTLAKTTDRLITIGGTVYGKTEWSKPADESAARALTHKIVQRVQETEEFLRESHAAEKFNLTHFRYPNLYGPRQLAPREWSIIRRLLDGRREIPVMDGGLTLESRAYVENAAQAVLLGVDNAEASAGAFYNVADELTPTDAQRAEAIAAAMNLDIRLVNYPREAAAPAYFWGVGRNLEYMGQEGAPPTHHKLLDISKMKSELGYRDVVPFEEAVRRTVAWYMENPLERGGSEEERIGDPFDYAGEDAFREALDGFLGTVAALPLKGVVFQHSYEHPKAPATTGATD